jgi:class 3 adenylate cyclase
MRCSKCGSENPDSKRFCGDCGAALPTATAPSIELPRFAAGSPTPEAELPEGERKTVTALFADINGSTELMEDLDPEEARAIIDPAIANEDDERTRREKVAGKSVFGFAGGAHGFETVRAHLFTRISILPKRSMVR